MAEALKIIDEKTLPLGDIEQIPLGKTPRRILAETIVSRINIPPLTNSAVDGFAFGIQSLNLNRPTQLKVVTRVAAGNPTDVVIQAGQAVRIYTGAIMPVGCETVAMQEDCDFNGDIVTIPPGLSVGANSRSQGEDVRCGEIILEPGALLRPQDVALAAATGLGNIKVFKPVKVAVFSTGDEVSEPGETLFSGSIYDSNRYMLLALLKSLPVITTDLGILPDNATRLFSALNAASANHDVLLTSGGVSVGDEDHIKEVVQKNGHLHLWRLAIKPGRPLALGQMNGKPFIGLPGNPVAAMVTFLRFARPLLLRLGGAKVVNPQLYPVLAQFNHRKKKNRREWLRANLVPDKDGVLWAHKFQVEGAGIIRSLTETSGLVELPEEVTEIKPGNIVDYLPFSEVLC